MNEEQQKANRQGNRMAACVIAYTCYCAVIAIGANNGAKAFEGIALGLCIAPALSIFVAIFLWNYVADLLQYHREGWNYDKRPTRSKFYRDEDSSILIAPRKAIWFGYPLAIIGSGGLAVLFWANVFGYWGK